jgi:hypothetical protein
MNKPMKLVCYAFKNQQNELEAPFLEYLQKYAPVVNETASARTKRIKQIRNLQEHLKFLLENQGNYYLPPIVEPYHGRSVGILKIKEGHHLVRIAFMTQKPSEIVLLDAIDKPSLYEKFKKQQTDKMIQAFLDRAEFYRQTYLKQPFSLPLHLPD